MKKLLLALVLAFIIALNGFAQISVSTFASGFSSPVDIKNCGDDRLFILEQPGRIQIVNQAGVTNPYPFLNITTRVKFGSEQGLLGLAFAPDFATSGYFYVNYTAQTHGDTRISRFRVDASNPDSVDPNTEEILLTIWQPYSNHNGGHLAFGPDGYLYIGTGDGGAGGDPENRAQNRDSLLGKMLRIKVDPSIPTYAIPPGNPYPCSGLSGREEIWSIGVRNPWRWNFDRITGDLWIGDVGQGTVEEIDFQPAWVQGGRNYGWRCWEGTSQYATDPTCLPLTSYTGPVHTYTHSGGNCSVTGGYRYRGGAHNDMWKKYFFTDYCVSTIRYLEVDANGVYTQTNLGNLGPANIVTFGEDRYGELYCSGIGSGIIYKFTSADCTPATYINGGMDTIRDCGNGTALLSVPEGPGFTYQWSFDGIPLPGADSSSYPAAQEGTYGVVVTASPGCTNSASAVFVHSTPFNVSFAGLDTLYCVYNSAVSLQPSVLGGAFSGPGIQCNTFDPAVAGIGTHEVSYYYTSLQGCSYVATQLVRVDACLGISDNAWLKTISIYPNPNSGVFTLGISSDKEKLLQLTVNNLLGQTVCQQTIAVSAGMMSHPVRANLSDGIYSITLSDGSASVTRTLVVQY
ncbi:MAG TPA: PQQ-dependent sugar dehydrogenase [Bacteroidia bacterium]|nr:PQQ-dependent sugar dehydrogenase [Bacteroidia bacterium]